MDFLGFCFADCGDGDNIIVDTESFFNENIIIDFDIERRIVALEICFIAQTLGVHPFNPMFTVDHNKR